MQPGEQVIALAGNLAAGKSTLASLVGVELGARVFPESTGDNPFLGRFYQDRTTWALHLETYFIARRSRQLLDASHAGVRAILDRSFYESRLFIESGRDSRLISPESYAILNELEGTLDSVLPRPAVLVYLHSPVQVLLDRLRARARPYEGSVDFSYLSNLQVRYDNWVDAYDYSPVLRVDTSEHDFQQDPAAVKDLAGRIERELARTPRRSTR